ncbi:hypothetical protein [Mariniluteicoccus flavus]
MSDPRAANDPEATRLRPRTTGARPGAVPPDAWENRAAWGRQAPEGRSGLPEHSRVAPPAGEGPQRSTARERPLAEAPLPEQAPVPQRVGMLLGAVSVLAALALLVPVWLTPAETATGRAISVAHGPAPHRAERAKLPAAVGDVRRDPAGDSAGLPFGQVDRALFVDPGGRPVRVLTQRIEVASLEEYDRRTGMQSRRFGRVSCGQRYDALQCTMLLDGGTISATTVDQRWQAEELAGFVRQAYAQLP